MSEAEQGVVRIIGIAGGSGSGKTTLAKWLAQYFGAERSGIISQDSYYFDQSSRFDHDGGSVNFDHPDAIDFDLMVEHMQTLLAGESVEIPIYDFSQHKRLERKNVFQTRPIVILDGILIFTHPDVRDLLDRMIFIHTPESVRFQRRLQRDTRERGRSAEGVKEQFYRQVKPMHDIFVDPSQDWADIVLNGEAPMERLIAEIEAAGIFADY